MAHHILPDFLDFISPRNKTVKSTLFDGFSFDSEKEVHRYKELIKLGGNKKLRLLAVHPKFLVFNEFKDNRGKLHKSIYYEPLFAYQRKNKKFIEDIKEFKNEAHEIKKKLFLSKYIDVEYREI